MPKRKFLLVLKGRIVCLFITVFAFALSSRKTLETKTGSLETYLKKENLIPWTIVGFDVKEHTPQQP
ncbi:hypothetical protein [Pontimicrobium sp. MEBiC01747]